MKLKINKACDLSSISVLPPQSRRMGGLAGGFESSRISGRSEMAASQLRSQQQSQQSFSQGISSQHGLFSQFSQNSQDDVLTNERLETQERENSVKRRSSLPPISYPRDENQMMVSRTSNNLARKWSGPEHKCQISEELEHRIGMIETSSSRLGMVLESVQSDIMQVSKGTKEIAYEIDAVRQKLIIHDESLQLLNKGQQDIKSRLDMGLKSLSDQFKLNMDQANSGEIFSMFSSLPEKIGSQLLQLRNELCNDFSKEMQAMACSVKILEKKQPTPLKHGPKATSWCLPLQDLHCPNVAEKQAPKTCSVPKTETGGWKTVKPERANTKGKNHSKSNQITVSMVDLERERINVTESDEEIDAGFSCLLKEKGTEIDDYLIEEAKEESARILRKARRRKRKHRNTIILD